MYIVKHIIVAEYMFVTCIKITFTGVNCEKVENLCNVNPCLNNGTCIQNGTLAQCVCTPGYEGLNFAYMQAHTAPFFLLVSNDITWLHYHKYAVCLLLQTLIP